MNDTKLSKSIKEVFTCLDEIQSRMHSSQDFKRTVLTSNFKDLCRLLLIMGHQLHEDLEISRTSDRPKEPIISYLITIQLYLPLLQKLLIINAPIADRGKEFVTHQMVIQLDMINRSLDVRSTTNSQSSPSAGDNKIDEFSEPGIFFKTVDTILEELSSNSVNLNWKGVSDQLNRLVSFATEVAQATTVMVSVSSTAKGATTLDDRIMQHCREVLRVQHKILGEFQDGSTSISKRNGANLNEEIIKLSRCVEQLELRVNIGVLEQLVDVFVQPTITFENVIQAIINKKSKAEIDDFLNQFHDHLDAIYQVCGFVVAFASNINCVRRIRTIIKIMEDIDLELIGAMVTSSSLTETNLKENCATTISYLNEIKSMWIYFMNHLTINVDQITDSLSFLRVTTHKLQEIVTNMKETLKFDSSQGDGSALHQRLYKMHGKFNDHIVHVLHVIRIASKELPGLDEELLKTSIRQLEIAHRVCLKTFKELDKDLINDENRRRFFKHCDITVTCVQKALSFMKTAESTIQSYTIHETPATIRSVDNKWWRESGCGLHASSEFKNTAIATNDQSTVRFVELFSLDLTEILENLQDSKCTSHQVGEEMNDCNTTFVDTVVI